MNENKPKTIQLNNEILESMIYTIRGEKVMLDLELASIFAYETKRLIEQVKRNVELFNGNSKFQITKNELENVSRSQNATTIATLNNTRGSNIKYMPYAFTIEGINTLINILKPKNEIAKNNVFILLKYINNNNDKNTKKWPSEANNYEIVKFESGNIMLDVRVSPNEDTIWLTQQEISILFDTTIPNINMHLTNIFEEKELSKNSVVKKSLITAADGKSYNTMLYNLDAVISIGFRVNTKRGIEFRRWANNILKNYLIKGYSINTKRCLEHSDIIFKLNEDVKSIVNQVSQNTNEIKELKSKLDVVMENFIDPNTYKHFLIKDGEKIEADVAYQSIYKLAKKSIYIIDDYIDIKTLQLLKCIKNNVEIIIFSDNKSKNSLTNILIEDFINDAKINILFKKNNNLFHSRYIIIDYSTENEMLFHSGASIKDGGKKINTIMKVEDNELYHALIDKVLNNEILIVK